MRIALCATEKDVDGLRRRIAAATVESPPMIDVFYSAAALMGAPDAFPYDALWIAIDGAKGMEAVIDIKECDPAAPVVWMSEDRMFAAAAYNLKVAGFLMKECMEEEITETLQDLNDKRRHPYEYRIGL